MEEKRFKRRVMTVVVACTLLAPYAPTARGAQENSLPHLRLQGTATKLVVDGKPFLILGGELGNSTSSSLEYMRPVWQKVVSLNLNTVLVPVYWELIEPAEGKFDFSLGDRLIQEARRHQLRFRWITYHAEEYKLDLSGFVLRELQLVALMAGMLPSQSVLDRQCCCRHSLERKNEQEIKVLAIVNWFGMTDVAELIDGPNAKHYAMEWFGSVDNREELARQVSPLSYVRAGLPPTITIQGDEDEVVPNEQAVRLHTALDKVGVPNRLVTIRSRKHDGFNRQELIDSFTAIREFFAKIGF